MILESTHHSEKTDYLQVTRKKLEELFDDPTLVSFLIERGVIVEEIEPNYPPKYAGDQENVPITLLSWKHLQKDLPETLPQGFAYMGGVARNTVLQELGFTTPPGQRY